MKRNFVFILCLQLLLACNADYDDSKKDAYLGALESNNAFMGSVSISKADKPIYSKSIGYKSIENKIKNDNKTQYCVGSISKSFTSALIFKAQEEGLLNTSNLLESYFPELPNSGKITLDDMLCHKSGLYNFTDAAFFEKNTEDRDRGEMLDVIKNGGSLFEPKSQFGYSNSNYLLLSYILEDLYGQTFSDILKTKITNPLKLKDTYFGVKTDRVSESYTCIKDWKMEGFTSPTLTIGAGGIISTTKDLNTFFYALFNNKIINKESLSKMKEAENGCARGLFVMPFGNKTGYGHTGGIDGFHSISVYFPEDEITYSAVSNGLNYKMNDITIAMLSDVYGVPYDIPDFKYAKNITSEDLDKYLGVYSTTKLPIKLTLTKEGNALMAQGTGQPQFKLEPYKDDCFRFSQGGIEIEFDPLNNSLLLKQGGMKFLMERE